MNSRWLALALALIYTFGVPTQEVLAAVIRVDEGCSLHDAIAAANTDRATGRLPGRRRRGYNFAERGRDAERRAAGDRVGDFD